MRSVTQISLLAHFLTYSYLQGGKKLLNCIRQHNKNMRSKNKERVLLTILLLEASRPHVRGAPGNAAHCWGQYLVSVAYFPWEDIASAILSGHRYTGESRGRTGNTSGHHQHHIWWETLLTNICEVLHSEIISRNLAVNYYIPHI